MENLYKKVSHEQKKKSKFFKWIYFGCGVKHLTLNWNILGSRLKSVHSFGMVILEIDKLSVSDAGKYSCTLKNAFGVASSSLTLGCVEKGKLEQAPRFTTHLAVSFGE